MQKTQKSEKTITFYMKNCKKEQFCFVLLMFFAFLPPRKPEEASAETAHGNQLVEESKNP